MLISFSTVSCQPCLISHDTRQNSHCYCRFLFEVSQRGCRLYLNSVQRAEIYFYTRGSRFISLSLFLLFYLPIWTVLGAVTEGFLDLLQELCQFLAVQIRVAEVEEKFACPDDAQPPIWFVVLVKLNRYHVFPSLKGVFSFWNHQEQTLAVVQSFNAQLDNTFSTSAQLLVSSFGCRCDLENRSRSRKRKIKSSFSAKFGGFRLNVEA